MLIQFRTENHRSLRDEQVLSLSAATAASAASDRRLIHVPGLQAPLLPAIAIYGANASGKSNVLHALAHMQFAINNSYRLWEPDGGVPTEPFLLSGKRAEPSLYEVEAIVGGTRFRYGFVLSERRVEEEWLFAYPRRHKQTWFEREGDKFEFGDKLKGDNETIRTLTRSNSLFLSAAAQNNHTALAPIFSWFRLLQVDSRRPRGRIAGNSGYADMLLGEMFASRNQLTLFEGADPYARERGAILALLKTADTGIEDIRVDDADEATGPSRLGRRRQRLQLRHKSENSDPDSSWLPLDVESAGTIALIDLAPKLTLALRAGSVACIDEMEASLHPTLALSLLSLFQDPTSNPNGAQLLFTTHDTNLLGTVLGDAPLRRDQVWFTEKDSGGATHLYPLTDFHPRKHENLERGYLQGRYGAIPFVGELTVDDGPAAAPQDVDKREEDTDGLQAPQ
jgi:predicted ATPase